MFEHANNDNLMICFHNLCLLVKYPQTLIAKSNKTLYLEPKAEEKNMENGGGYNEIPENAPERK